MPTNINPLNISDFPKAILHIDADCFFASCHIALEPKLRGKPVITGKERGIASSMSYEAKASGVKRGMVLSQIKKICPGAVILNSDYENYSLFSMRMFDIVRHYTPQVEEYSIDECFADLTGLQRPLNACYENIARRIKHNIESDLGITVSAGLAPTKVLAKVGSKWQKPSGFTAIPANTAHLFLAKTRLAGIWGIGPATSEYLCKCGLKTALELAQKNEEWVKNRLTKPHYEIWQELRGTNVYPVICQTKNDYRSISKTKTFLPASGDRGFVFAQLSKNIENACIKARRHHLAAKRFIFFIKNQQFACRGTEIKLPTEISTPSELIGLAQQKFNRIWQNGQKYRATGAILADLVHCQAKQMDLFGDSSNAIRSARIFEKVDEACAKFGKHAVFLGSSFAAIAGNGRNGIKNAPRAKNLFARNNSNPHFNIPLLGSVK